MENNNENEELIQNPGNEENLIPEKKRLYTKQNNYFFLCNRYICFIYIWNYIFIKYK